MDQETLDVTGPPPVANETEPPAQPGVEPGPPADVHPLDARALVEKMIDAGQSPEPDLMEQIAAAGHEAVEPLLAILRAKPRGWPEETPLYHALGLLQVIRDPAAIPELIEIVKGYPDESGEEAAETLACYGEGIFDTVLNLAADPAIRAFPRSHAITAARQVAGTNPTLRARLSDVIRPMLHDAVERALRPPSDEPKVHDWSDQVYGWDIYCEISLLVIELAGIADPLARELIQTAFDSGLNDQYFIDEKMVEESYDRGGDPEWTPSDWLARYRESHREDLAIMKPIKRGAAANYARCRARRNCRRRPYPHSRRPCYREPYPHNRRPFATKSRPWAATTHAGAAAARSTRSATSANTRRRRASGETSTGQHVVRLVPVCFQQPLTTRRDG